MIADQAVGFRVASTRVVWGGGGEPLVVAPGWVEIEGSLVCATRRTQPSSHSDELAALDQRTTTIDFGDRLVSPAFVNAHTHLALGFLRGSDLASGAGNLVVESMFKAEEGLCRHDVVAFARMGAFESLLHGVGLVWDHYYHGAAVAQALVDSGLCGVVAPTLQDVAGPGRDDSEAQLESTRDIASSPRLASRGVFAAVGPHATDTVSDRLWRQAADLAAELELPLHCHLAQSLEEFELSVRTRGLSPTAWLLREGLLDASPANLMAHGLFLSRSDLEALKPQRDVLVYCPYSQLVFAFPAAIDAWLEAGVSFAVATDCSSTNDSFNLQKELRFVAGQRTAGVTSSQAYRQFLDAGGVEEASAVWAARKAIFERHRGAATTDDLLRRVWSLPGRLHPSFRAGVIEPGALANLVVWDLDHPSFWPDPTGLRTLAVGDTTQAIHALFVGGRRIGEAGDFHRSVTDSDEYREARAEANERLRRLS